MRRPALALTVIGLLALTGCAAGTPTETPAPDTEQPRDGLWISERVIPLAERQQTIEQGVLAECVATENRYGKRTLIPVQKRP